MSMKKYLKFIKREKMPQLVLEDKKMPMTEVSKTKNSLKFIHPGGGSDVSAARTSEPLPSNAAAVYFEAYIKNLPSHYEVGVGVIQKDCALKRHPGESNMSIGYLSSGDIMINTKKVKVLSLYQTKSVVGIGVIYSKSQAFFTLNGKLLDTISFEHNPATWPKFYPCISLRSDGDHIQLIFKNFQFNFAELESKIEKQCIEEIEKENLGTLNMYTLVGDYLKFHGYGNAYNELKKNHSFLSLNPFIHHPCQQSKLTLTDVQTLKPKQIKIIQQSPQDQINIQRKCSMIQKIMSDYWGDICPNDQTNRKISQNQLTMLQNRRKSSVLSNLSNDEIDNKMVRKTSEGDRNEENFEKQESQLDKFLLSTRVAVLKFMREEEIEKSLELLEKSLPQLFQVCTYLKPYFYMQIYLRTLKNEGASKAMTYMKNQAEQFKDFKEVLYPAYSKQQNKLKFVAFSQMMKLISLKPGQQNDALTTNQFCYFSNYLNEIILKNMGYYPQSRLDIMVNHLKSINNKNEQFQINGLSFLCDI